MLEHIRLGLLVVLFPVQVGVAAAEEDARVSVPAKVEIWRHSRLEQVRRATPDALQPFTTDGCSGGMSAAWEALAEQSPWFYEVFETRAPWHHCCVIHDRAYHLGGDDPAPEAGYWARVTADEALRACVQEVGRTQSDALAAQYGRDAEEVAAIITFVGQRMYEAVRLGGWPCSGLTWRWGYGWPQCW
ncbi:hypothetical protein J7413_01030 [Shimia sp. R10_1]|uniref:hypothetical protein n=1 Tax=Shimia sp. R10_1 TaxID=2821095 RepID=UPI001ADA7C32|nr:hypothetical protein [Shimia sp. R10_1]MBO9472111.1 hypothetical protein [Shimia sp. R10_1]